MPRLPLLAFTLAAFSACTAHSHRNIPGLGSESRLVKVDQVPPLSSVMAELRVQLADAFTEFATARAESPSDVVRKELDPKGGKLTFSGKTQLVSTGSGNLSAVFPFSGYTGSTLTPNFGVSSSATSSQETKLSVSFEPKDLAASRGSSDKKGYVTNALVTGFEELIRSVEKEGTVLANRTLTLELSFVIAKTNASGLGVTFIPSAPDLNSIGSGNPPMLGTSKNNTGTYTLSVEVPFLTPDAGDPKTILTGVMKGDSFYLIERPYTPAEQDRAHNFVERAKQQGAPEAASSLRRVFGEREAQAGGSPERERER